MPLFRADSIALCCSNVETCKKWWMESFDCKQANVPEHRDCILPSDVALTLPEDASPTILLSDWAEVRKAGYERSNDHPIIFCKKLSKAHEFVRSRGAAAGPIQNGGGTSSSKSAIPKTMLLRSVKNLDNRAVTPSPPPPSPPKLKPPVSRHIISPPPPYHRVPEESRAP